MLNEYLDFDVCANLLANAAGRALGAVIGKTRCLKELGFKTYNKLFETGVLPILEYGSEIWGYRLYKCSEGIQEKAIRYFLALHRFTPIPELRGEVGWMSTRGRRWIGMVRFWNRLIKMTETRLNHIVFKWDYTLSNHNDNWSSELRAILSTFNMPHIFDQKCFCNLDLLKQKCREYDKEEWLNQIQQKPKLRTYILFKSLLETEFYVTCLPKSQRSVFSKLRCGVLPLKIETGIFNAIDRENRICEFCSLNEVEDEQHFLCRCTLYNDLRVKMYHSAAANNNNFNGMPDQDKFIYLMQQRQTTTSKFCWSAFNKRRQELYTI